MRQLIWYVLLLPLLGFAQVSLGFSGAFVQIRGLLVNHSHFDSTRLNLLTKPGDGTSYGYFGDDGVSHYLANLLAAPYKRSQLFIMQSDSRLCQLVFENDANGNSRLAQVNTLPNAEVTCVKSMSDEFDVEVNDRVHRKGEQA